MSDMARYWLIALGMLIFPITMVCVFIGAFL